ncbi:MAG: single-stranded DNA-binding protein [Candidatus Magasanikbacteria bacterium CG10_big_fil_rev_8_21_14_0_10_36_32]|uniref:Single-stranded DNA-binding protein n=1 Tax=Candidatus Magasanikbacteria bacterium CG10_big_fil_rev_8_21_14_0_10_36_32 TaxID=1974646 RepID=A0A2M6W730_9BACT|nr:MAG: single-stranded DNA-binding protein [Candidatus Magasanikbacteria bacterium CG10_big_fil_rev_8_21_14_0_10_36_32]
MDLNRITIIGNMTRDPEVRTTPNGKSVASFSVATNRYWTDQNGQKQKETEFHNVVLWTKLADVAGQYLHKGNKIYIEGRLRTREWTAQDGTKRTRTEIIGENMIMLGGRPSGAVGSTVDSNGQIQSATTSESGPQEVIEEEIKVEDIPF